jgi:single-strand DNA-binding protein
MHTVPFKLNENAQEFQAGEYTGFGIRTGVKYQDQKTKQDAWTNFKAAIFSKSPAQIEFYRANLIKGALVVVSSDKLAVEVYSGQNGQQTAIKLLNANVQAVMAPRAPDAAHQAYNQGVSQNQPAQNKPAPQIDSFDSMEDDIPF